MRRVFVDVGAHTGETLEAALDDRWGFTEIHCVEPVSGCWEELEQRADSRTTVHRFGLWSSDGLMDVYDPGQVGASLFGEKALGVDHEQCEVRDIRSWWEELRLSDCDSLYMKFNVEGAEAELLSALADAELMCNIDHLVVHMDIRKVPSLASSENSLVSRLNESGVQWFSAEQIMYGRNPTEKTNSWLAWCDGTRSQRFYRQWVRRLEFGLRTALYRFRVQRGRR